MNAAAQAETALEWFREAADAAGAMTVVASVQFGSATNVGKAAQPYVHRAAQTMHGKILELAKELAEEDLRRGEELL